jgi:hypothetical protein
MLNLLNFILTTVNSYTEVNICTDNPTFITYINLVTSIKPHNYSALDKQQYTYLLLILKALSCNRKLNITLDENIKIKETTGIIFPLDPAPQHFLYNRFVPRLLNKPCGYLLKTTLKHIHQITNRLSWFGQQRISGWHTSQNNIDWTSTLKYISFEEKPLALNTDPSSSAIKNFKIKLLSEELPTYLLLH